MVAYRYLGSALTNANGVATFDYQGTGAGEIDVLASLDNPIVDGSIVSVPCNVLDCEWYDDCKSATHNTNWFNRNQLQTDYTGDVLKLTSGANGGNYMPNKDGTATSITDVTEWTPSFALELDIVDFSDNTKSNIGISTVGRNISQLGITGATHLKITYDGSNVNYYKDGSTQPTYTASLTADPIYISIGVSSGHYLTIKNVEIYPI